MVENVVQTDRRALYQGFHISFWLLQMKTTYFTWVVIKLLPLPHPSPHTHAEKELVPIENIKISNLREIKFVNMEVH